jgi:predicted branched-subunit amino acid permease
LLGSGVAIYVAWVSATVVGALASGLVTDVEQYGLDFALTAVFITLLVGQWDGRSDLLPWVSAAVVAVVASRFVPGSAYILLGGLAGMVVAVVTYDD